MKANNNWDKEYHFSGYVNQKYGWLSEARKEL